MKLEWLGHACFRLTSKDGPSILTDPYKSGSFDNALRYAPADVEADIVTVSHEHEDHFDLSAVRGSPYVVQEAGVTEHRGVRIEGFETFHDPSRGAERGANRVFKIGLEGLEVVHLGDLGHVLAEDMAREIGRADVLLAPVGGFFTIDKDQALEVAGQLEARILVPMHFKTAKVDFPIEGVEGFLEKAPGVKRLGDSVAEILEDALPARRETWVLEPAR